MRRLLAIPACLSLGLVAAGCVNSAASGTTASGTTASGTTVAAEPVTTEVAPEAVKSSTARTTSIEYSASFEEALQTAKSQNKPLMVDFYTDWCGVCKMMEQRVLNQPEVVEQARKFVTVKVNAEKREDLARAFAVSGYPTFVWLDTQGNVIDRLDGGMMKEGFLARMQEAHSKFAG